MKMGFLASGVFWGSVIILFGISIILNSVFGISIPVFKIVLALILIYFGISILAGKAFNVPKVSTINDKTIDVTSSTKVNNSINNSDSSR